MRYAEFLDAIDQELRRSPEGLTWAELRDRLGLPYERPCPSWTRRLEQEIGLTRTKGTGLERLRVCLSATGTMGMPRVPRQ